MSYTKQTWENLPSTTTPITADRLNHMENGIYDANTIQVQDSYSESTTNPYSCNYINQVNTGIVLYDNSDGTAGNVLLSDSSANYNYIEIFYAKGEGSYNNCKIFSPNGKMITLSCASNYNSTSLQELWKHITISGNTITSDYGLARNSSTSGIGNPVQENSVKIYKVIGYK